MFLSEPPRTQYDLHFDLAGFPVRVHPLFWLAAIILGAGGLYNEDGVNAGLLLVSWIVVMFVSILVHELGHALAMQYYGQRARIVLYMMGGLAIPDTSPYSFGYGSSRSPQQQIVISAAGPAAGFALALVTIGLLYAAGGQFGLVSSFPFFWRIVVPPDLPQPIVNLISFSLYINIFWGLVNLLPIYPLDGGHIAREILVSQDPGRGIIRSLWLSVFAAAGVACWGLFQGQGGIFIALLFGSLAYSSYMVLQQLGGGGFGGGGFGGGGFGGGGYGGGGRPW